MITGQGLTYQVDEKKTESCEDFSFKGGVRYLSYSQKDIFQALALSSIPFASGSLSVDGVTLTAAGFASGTAKVMKLDVKNTGSLTLVMFYPGKEEESTKAFEKLASQLKAIKFPAETEEDKKQKLVMLKTVLSLNPISYILIDLNDPLTQKNRALWDMMFLDYKGTAFFLSENPEKASLKATGEKVPLKKALYLPYRIPLLLTSFLAIFLSAYAQSMKIKVSSKWGLALGAAIVFLIANIVIGVFLSKKIITKDTKKEVLTSFELVSTVTNVIGVALGLLCSYFLSEKMSILSKGLFQGFGLTAFVLFGIALLFAQLAIGHKQYRSLIDISLFATPSNKSRKKDREISAKNEKRIGIILSYITMAVNIVITIVYTPFKLSHLGGSPETADIQYGLNSFVESITTWLSLISTAMSASYIRFATMKGHEDGEKGVRQISALYLIFSLFFIALAILLGTGLYYLFKYDVIPLNGYTAEQKEIILDLLLISLASISSTMLYSVFGYYIGYKEKFIVLRSILLISAILAPAISYPFLLKGCNVQTVVLITLAVTAASYLCLDLYSILHLHQRFNFSFNKETKKLIRDIVVFSSFILFTTIVDQIDTRIDKTILGFMAPPEVVDGPSQVTLYQLGQSFISYIITASATISVVFIPEVNKLYAEGKNDQIGTLFLKVSRIQMIVVFMIVGGFWACGYDFIRSWVGDNRVGSFYVAAILFTINLVPLTESLSVEVQRAANKHKFQGIVYFFAALINIGLSILFVYLFDRHYAIYGCLLGTALAAIPSKWIINNWYNSKIIKLPMRRYWFLFLRFTIGTATALGLSYLIFLALPSTISSRMAFLAKGLIFFFIESGALVVVNKEYIKPLFKKITGKNERIQHK